MGVLTAANSAGVIKLDCDRSAILEEFIHVDAEPRTPMLDTLFRSLEDTFVKFSFRRLVFWVFLIIVGVVTVYAFERYTGLGHNIRLDGELTALERLHALEKNGIASSPALAKEYERIVTSLHDDAIGKATFLNWSFEKGPIVKFLAATAIWWALLIFGVIAFMRGDNSSQALIFGSVAFLVLLGIPSLMIPDLGSYWVNATAFMVIQMLLIAWMAWKGQQK